MFVSHQLPALDAYMLFAVKLDRNIISGETYGAAV
jgi:hypothetical protein